MEIPGIDLIERVGTGGMSEVYKAWDHSRNGYVAVKILNKEFSSSVVDIAQFREEERFMSEIRHEGIVQAYDLHFIDGLWLMVMEFVDGYTFAQLLGRKQHVNEEDCLLILESVAAALHYTWTNHHIVHCDIKPENIMINREGVVKLTDLGIAHRFHHVDETAQIKTVSEHVIGTPSYISPEQVFGDVQLDTRTDIYSLGASIYHLATGRVLFPHSDAEAAIRAQCDPEKQAKDPRIYRPELSRGFVQLLERMLVKDRDGRIGDWAEVYRLAREVENGATLPDRADDGYPSSLLLAGE